MGIEPVSFLATDLVIIAGLSKPLGQQKQLRRTVQVAEVKKSSIDTVGEKEIEVGFNDLLLYDPARDELVPTTVMWDPTRGTGTSELISSIAAKQSVRYEDALRNIGVRAIIRKILTEGNAMTDKDLCDAKWLVQANNSFWGLSSDIVQETNSLNHSELLRRWMAWFSGVVPEVNLDELDLSYAAVGLQNLPYD
jgi:hypothetical protein